MDRQIVFNKVIAHLEAQGHRAMAGGRCRYLAANGDRCAVGCLLPADFFVQWPQLEGAGVESILNGDGAEAVAFADALDLEVDSASEDAQLLARLQELHDDSDNWDPLGGLSITGYEAAQAVANEFGLEYVK